MLRPRPHPRALLLAALLFAAVATAGVELQPAGATLADEPLTWTDWDGRTLAVTDGGIKLVDWNAVVGTRAEDVHIEPLNDVRLVAWGDSVLADRPGVEDDLLVVRSITGAISVRTVPAGWHLANTRIDGTEWYVDATGTDLAVYPARSESPAAAAVPLAAAVAAPDEVVTSGDRAAVCKRTGDQTSIQLFDLADPLAPVAGQVITHDQSAWIALRERTLLVAEDLLCTYDATDIDEPAQLYALGPAGPHSRPAFRDDGVFAVWRDRDIRLVDARNPADLRPGATLPAVLPDGDDPWPLCLQDERLVARGEHGLHSWTLPAAHYVLLDDGVGWWRPEGELLATDGHRVFLQGERRYVMDLLGSAGRIELLGVVESSPPSTGAFLGLTGDHLVYADGAGDVTIEDVSQPLVPVTAAVIDLPTQVRVVGLAAPDLVLVRTGLVDVYDLSDPSAPQAVATLDDIEHPTDVVVQDGLATVLDHVNGQDDSLWQLDLSVPGSPEVVSVHQLGGDGWIHRVVQMCRRGANLMARVVRTQGGDVTSYTLRLDLTDPAAPLSDAYYQQLYFWGDWSVTPVELAGIHVTVETDRVFLNDFQGDPVLMPILDILTLPARVEAVAASGNQLVALYGRSLVRCTASNLPPVAAPAPDPAASPLRAVPNPFNPRTEVTFAMDHAGRATVDVYDLRGRRVTTLRAQLPAGPARLVWEGTDDAGRALPSGTYLLRVRTAGQVQTARCALVR